MEKISQFDRERIPERVVHARGFLAYGMFTATGRWGDEPIERYTRAKLFSAEGKQTDVALWFSTVIGGRDSSEAARDPRGFAVKFYTEGVPVAPKKFWSDMPLSCGDAVADAGP